MKKYKVGLLDLIVLLLFVGCSGNNGTAPVATLPSGVVSISGVAADGPISGGMVTVTDATGAVVGTGVTDQAGKYNVSVPQTAVIPLDITISGGIDTISNKPQDFPVSTAVTTPVANINQLNANANAFTTIIVAAAKAEAASKGVPFDAAILASATTKVVGNIGFGLDPAIDPINTPMTASNTADMIKANEALSELIRRTTTDKVISDNAATASAGQATGTITTAKVATLSDVQAVIASMAADVSDGILDGNTTSQAVLDAATKSVNDSYANAAAGMATAAATNAGKSVAQAAVDAGAAKQQAAQKAIVAPSPVEAQATVTLAQVNTVQVITEVLTNTLQVTDTTGSVIVDAATTQVNMDRYAAASAGLRAGSVAANSVSTANVDASKSNQFLKKQIAVAVATAKAVVVSNDTYSASTNIQTSANQTGQLAVLQTSVFVLIDSAVQKAAAVNQATLAGKTAAQIAVVKAQQQAALDVYTAMLTVQRDAYANTITATKIDAVTTVSVQVTVVKVTQQLATQVAQGAAVKTAVQVQAVKDTAQQNAVLQVATVAAKDIYTQQVVQQQTQQAVAVQVQQVTQQRQQGTSLIAVDAYAQAAQQTATATVTTSTAQAQQAAATTVSNVNVSSQNTLGLSQVVQASNTNTQQASTQANSTANANAQAAPPNFITWNWVNKAQEQARYHINDVVWNGKVFVAVADKGVIRSSVDGRNWVLRSSGTNENLTTITANPATGAMVATGTNGTLLTSSDGITWGVQRLNVFGDFTDSYWSGTLFLVAESSGTLFSSVDGKAWTVVHNSIVSRPYGYGSLSIASDNAGRLVILNGPTISKSLDAGVTWSSQAMPVTNAQALVWAGTQYVAVGWGGVVATSVDAYTWTLQVSGVSNSLTDVRWTGTKIIASGAYGSMISSVDGVNWAIEALPTDVPIRAMASNATVQVAVGEQGTILSSPAPAGIWSLIQSSALNRFAFNDMLWNGVRFVGVGGGGLIQTSLDGYSWTKRVSGTKATLNALSWNGTRFIAVGSRATVLQSVDGVAWTVVPTGIAPTIPLISKVTGTIQTIQQFRLPDLYDVDQRAGLIVAVGEEGAIISSNDGIAWTAQNSGLTPLSTAGIKKKPSLASIALGANLMVATTGGFYNPSGPIELVSTDTINWQGVPNPPSLRTVSSSGTSFVATDSSGALYHSMDAYTWTWTSKGLGGSGAVFWDGARFVAFGTGLRTSLDGVTWSEINSAEPISMLASNGQYWTAMSGRTPLTSINGKVWSTTNAEDPASISDIASNGVRMVAVGRSADGNAAIRISNDKGVTWINIKGLPRLSSLHTVVWGGTHFVALSNRNKILSSVDGLSWQTQTSAITNENFMDLIWTGTQFVIVGNQSIQTSVGGGVWTQHLVVTPSANPSNPSIRLYAMAVSPKQWVIAAAGGQDYSGYNDYIVFYSSTDQGLTWIKSLTPLVEGVAKNGGYNLAPRISQMIWTGSAFVAASYQGILRSVDAISWSFIAGVSGSSLATDGYSIVATPTGYYNQTQTQAWVSTDNGITWIEENEILPRQASRVIYDSGLMQFVAVNRTGQVALSAAPQPALLLVPVAKSFASPLVPFTFEIPPNIGNYAYPNPTLMTMTKQSVSVQDYYASGAAKPLQTATATIGKGLTVNLPALNAANAAALVAGKATATAPTILVPFSALPDVSSGQIRVQAIVKDGTSIARLAGERWMGVEYNMNWSMSATGGFKLSPVGEATLSYSLSTAALKVVAKMTVPAKDINLMAWDANTKTMSVAVASNMFAIKTNGASVGSMISSGGNYFYEVQVGGVGVNYMPPLADSQGLTFTKIQGTFSVR